MPYQGLLWQSTYLNARYQHMLGTQDRVFVNINLAFSLVFDPIPQIPARLFIRALLVFFLCEFYTTALSPTLFSLKLIFSSSWKLLRLYQKPILCYLTRLKIFFTNSFCILVFSTR